MVAGFWPEGEHPITASPSFRWQAPMLTIRCETNGASLGYRINGGRWQVYSGAFGAAPDDYVEARAVRYGWRESEATKFEVPR